MKKLQERQRITKAGLFAEKVLSTIREIFFYSLAIAVIIGSYLIVTSDTVKAMSQQTTLEAMPTKEHIADVGKMIDTHFVVSYYVDGQRYVRKLSLATATLLEGVAKDEGVDSSVLIAMCLQESSVPNPDGWMYGCDPTAVGDNGQAHGMFQIHNAYHDISLADSRHPYYSAVWTAHRLIRKGYKYNRERAIRCHNSCSPSNNYGKRILQIAKTLKPITK